MSAYTLYLIGPDGGRGRALELDCDADQEAASIAFGAISAFGHELWCAGDFLGWFSGQGCGLDERD